MTAVRKSLGLSALDSYLGLVLQLASTVIIARILTPEQTGVFAVAAVFAGLASTFRDFGVAEYMIQEPELTRERIRAALALNIIVSWSMSLVLLLGAHGVGRFYGSEGVTRVMWVQAANFLLIPFGAVTQAWFRRELNYRPIVICNLLSNVSSFAVAVTMALLGFGYMALAWGSFAGIVTSVAAASCFRPAGFPRRPGLKGIGEVFRFGKFASGIYIGAQIGKGAPEMMLGRAATMADVGMFSRARGMVEMFHRIVLRPVLQVCLPYFAQSERDGQDIVKAYLKSVSYLTAVGWTFLAFMAVAAFAAIRIIYGPQWLDAVVPAQVLCAACALELVFLLSREALLARGQAARASALQLGLLALQLIGLLAAIPYGLMGASWGLLAAAAAGIALSQWHMRRGTGLRGIDLARGCVPSLGVAVVAVGPFAALTWVIPIGAGNFLWMGALGALSTTALWVVALRVLGHGLWQEVSSLPRRISSRLAPRRA